jgi:VIT1/CCC1 family predicted Fe2+/Mn2+ transporter
MCIASTMSEAKRSFLESSGTIIFGMEDGTVSIFGLVFGVAATTSSSAAIIIAGPSGATAAAAAMMAGFFSAAIPIQPFALLPVRPARIVSASVTLTLLFLLGLGRARIGSQNAARTIAETVSIGIAAALAGFGIGMRISFLCT